MLKAAGLPLAHIVWRPCYRLIASRYPTVSLYDSIADPADLDVVFAIEALTNPRIRDELGHWQMVPPEHRRVGPGSTPIMAAFTHLNPQGSRFSDGSYGVYYAADTLETAVAEVSHHRGVFLARTAEPAIDVDMRLVCAELDASLHDLRCLQRQAPAGPASTHAQSDFLDPDHYGAPQDLGRKLRAAGSSGLVYPSVRHAPGTCAALFTPLALRHATHSAHIALHWNGARISHWYRKDDPQTLA